MSEIRLYIDIDGVLHRFSAFQSQEDSERSGHYRVCRDGGRVYWPPTSFEHLPVLASILSDFPEVRIYVHSTWRHMWAEDRADDMADFFGPLAERYVRNVPRYIKGRRIEVVRGDMLRDGYTGSWVAVDDDDDGFTEAGFGAHFVKTDSRDGLGSSQAQARLRALLTHARTVS